MNGTFNGVQSTYAYDHARDEFYRAQEQERRDREHVARAAHWMAVRLAGKTFGSYDALRAACVDVVIERYGAVDDQLAGVIQRGITALWMGQVERVLIAEPKIWAVVSHPIRTVTFVAA